MPDPEVVRLAGEWLAYARGDLAAAQQAQEDSGFQPRHACLFAQQAAEKAMKSLLVLEQIEFPFTHDLVELRQLVPSRYSVHDAGLDPSALNRWITAARYPGDPDPTDADAREAVDLATRVVQMVEADFEREGAGG